MSLIRAPFQGLFGKDVGCRVTHSVNQLIPNNIETVLSFDTERWDTDTLHDNIINNSRITIRRPGKYLVFCNIAWAANVSGLRDLFIRLNGGTIIGADDQQAVTVAIFGSVHGLAFTWDFAANDFIDVRVLQTSGVALNVEKQNAWSPEFGVQKIDRGG